MDLLGLNMPPAILLGADEVIEQDARARKLKLSRSQLGTWTKDSFGSFVSSRRHRKHVRTTPESGCIAEVPRTGASGHERSYENVLGHLVAHRGRSGPFQARKDRASHHPVLVALRQEAQLFGEMGDALAVACLGERVRDVGPPMAALRTEGVE